MAEGGCRLSAVPRRPDRLAKVEPPVVAGRVPVHDLDAEAAVLSACLEERAVSRVRDIVRAEHFYSEANGRIFEAVIALADDEEPIDIVTVASWLRDRERLAQVGGAGYLQQIAYSTPAVANVEAHARIVREKARIRSVVATCQRAAAEGYGDVGDPAEWLDALAAKIEEAALDGAPAAGVLLGKAMHGYYGRIASNAPPDGLPTGYPDIDRLLGGLYKKRVAILGARPGVGKSSLARGIARNVACHQLCDVRGQPLPVRLGVVLFSLEMSLDEVAGGFMCAEAGVDTKLAEMRGLETADWANLAAIAPKVSTMAITIDDTAGLSLADIRARTRRYASDFARLKTDFSGKVPAPPVRLALVIIDQVQLIRTPGAKGVTRQQELGEVSRGLKKMAKEFDVPILALAALNRDVEKAGRRPQLSDLRECGDLESDADVVAFLHRDQRTAEERAASGGRREKGGEKELQPGEAEFIVRKARIGSVGKASLRFYASCARFDPWSPDR